MPFPPPASVLFFCFVCCRTSGKSCLYGLSPVPPLLFSLKPASVRLSPLLLMFLRTPSRSLRPSDSHFPALSTGLSQHWSSPLPRKCFFLGLPGHHMPGSSPLHSVPDWPWSVGMSPGSSSLLYPLSRPCWPHLLLSPSIHLCAGES